LEWVKDLGGNHLLLRESLVRCGFDELNEFPKLTDKLVRSTGFRFIYGDFFKGTKSYVSSNLNSTLRSWIDERGSNFRTDLPLLIFSLWKQKTHKEEITFSNDQMPLVSDSEMNRLYKLCEWIYFDILVERFKGTLEGFDPSLFVTMYAVDAFTGYEFEDFLAKLFQTIGYDVQVTKRTGDQGADLFVEKFGRKTVIQAKNYFENVGNASVQQALAAKTFYSCDHAMVVTNRYFTPSAKELAEAAGVKLIDRKILEDYLEEFNRMIMEAKIETK